jgi:hypothetical protein
MRTAQHRAESSKMTRAAGQRGNRVCSGAFAINMVQKAHWVAALPRPQISKTIVPSRAGF